MDRRELLKLMALSLGASIALPESVFAQFAEPFDISKLKFFTPAERALVAVITETIIPETDTPGAISAGVPGWLELLVQDCFAPEDRSVISNGLSTLEMDCAGRFNKGFAELPLGDRVRMLTELEIVSKKAGDSKTFIRQFKELTKFTYVNSEAGGSKAFDFVLIPGRWDPAANLLPGQKAYSM